MEIDGVKNDCSYVKSILFPSRTVIGGATTALECYAD